MEYQLLIMEKYKYILTVIITLCTIITYAQPAQYTPMTASGYQMKRLKVDSTLHLPSFCGVPTLLSSTAKEGALAIDTCGALLYMWTRTGGWDTVNVSGGGGSGVNQDLQSVLDEGNFSYNKDINLYGKTSANQIYLSGLDNSNMPYFALGDSIGGGLYQYTYPQATIEFINKFMTQKLKQQDSIRGTIYLPAQISDATDTLAKLSDVREAITTPTLQQVTDAGSTTTNTIIVGDVSTTYIGIDPNQFVVGNGIESISITSNRIKSTNSSGAIDAFKFPTSATSDATIPISVNGNFANTAGNITITSTLDTTNQFVKRLTRTPGKDSIIYYVGGTRYAIKDSVGNTSGFVPYTGATQNVNLGSNNIIVNNVDARTTTLTASNQTIQLTLDSSFIQLATGTTSNIFYNLPNATTLNVGASFQFNNNITSGSISVRNFGVVNTIATIPSGGAVQIVLLTNTTTTGTWDVLNYCPKNTSWGTDSLTATSTKVKFSSLVLGTPLTVANGGADSTTYNTKYRSDTSRTNIYTAINGKLNITDTSSLSNRINATPTLTAYQLLGSTIKAFPIGVGSFTNATVALAQPASRMNFVAIYIPQTTTVTGVKWVTTSVGTTFVGSANYNGFALYSYNVGTGLATRQDSTANDNTIWNTLGFNTKAFVTPVSLSAGIYYIGAMCNGTAVSFPSISQSTQTSTVTTYDFTSPARLTGYVTGTVSPATFNLSTATGNTNYPVIALY
jgi:hypothetical protein